MSWVLSMLEDLLRVGGAGGDGGAGALVLPLMCGRESICRQLRCDQWALRRVVDCSLDTSLHSREAMHTHGGSLRTFRTMAGEAFRITLNLVGQSRRSDQLQPSCTEVRSDEL